MTDNETLDAIRRTLYIRCVLLEQKPDDPEEIAAWVAVTDMAARILDVRWIDLRTAVREAVKEGRSVRAALVGLPSAKAAFKAAQAATV